MRRRDFTRLEPSAVDPRSGFVIPLSHLVKDGQTGNLVDRKRADKKHPQEFVRAIPERPLPFTRPEPPDLFIAEPILYENYLMMTQEDGSSLIYEEGEVALL